MRLVFLFFILPFMAVSQTFQQEVIQLFEEKKFVIAEKRILNFVAENNQSALTIELLGDAYGHQRDWDKAIKQYKKLVNIDDSNANYHYKYGGALGMKALKVNKVQALGLIGDIKRSFTKAAELDPEHIDARWALVELYMQLPGIVGGSKKKSLKYAEELFALSKVDGYLARGYVYEYDKQPDLAEKNYKRAIEIGGSLTCFQELSDFYQSQDQPENAIATIEQSYEKHNKNALHYQIGKVCADYNIQLDKGERCLKEYIKNYSAKDGVPVEWAYFRLAQIYKNRKMKSEALQWIDKAIAVRANFKQAIKEKEKIQSL